MSRVITSPQPTEAVLTGNLFARLWWGWVSRVTSILQGKEPIRIASYTVATLPPAADWSGGVVIVSNEAGGHTLAVSDGTDWLRVSDGTEVS